MRKKLLSLLLAVTMITSMFNTVALAADVEEQKTEETQIVCEICGHEHDEECGYAEGTEGLPCSHEHTEECYREIKNCIHEHLDGCYPESEDMDEGEDAASPSNAKSGEPTECSYICSLETGCITRQLKCSHEHGDDCGYVAPTESVPCNHQHTAECGYAVAVEGAPCQHKCVKETLPLTTLRENGKEYTVSTSEDFTQALATIEESEDTEATIVFTANNIDVNRFEGVVGKHVTLKSTDSNNYTIMNMGNSFIGDLTFDNVIINKGYSIYANGNTLTFGENFIGSKYLKVFGGSNGTDLTSDTHIIIYGGIFGSVVGGSMDGINRDDWGDTVKNKHCTLTGNTKIDIYGGVFAQMGSTDLVGNSSTNTIVSKGIYGAGIGSDTLGNTNVNLYDGAMQGAPNIYGGGAGWAGDDTDTTVSNNAIKHTGNVHGDTNLTITGGKWNGFYGGGFHNGSAYSSSSNLSEERDAQRQFHKDNVGTITGTAYVSIGGNANITDFFAGGSYASTIGNIRISISEQALIADSGSVPSNMKELSNSQSRDVRGSGESDIVKETVEIHISGGYMGNVFGVGDAVAWSDADENSSKILNEADAPYAVSITMIDGMVTNLVGTKNSVDWGSDLSFVNGNISMSVKGGQVLQMIGHHAGCATLPSDSNIDMFVEGGMILDVVGESQATQNQSSLYVRNTGSKTDPQLIGCINLMDQVVVGENTVLSLTYPEIRLAFGYSQSTSVPFHYVYGLDIKAGSTLITCNQDTQILGNAGNAGLWVAAGKVSIGGFDKNLNYYPGNYTSTNGSIALQKSENTIYGDFSASNALIYIPAYSGGKNYPTDKIPLSISGKATGNADVFTTNEDNWTILVKPVVGENYIRALREGSENVFKLANADAVTDGLYFKKLVDADDTSPENDMWQVAKGYTVTYNANGGSGTLVDKKSPYEPTDTVTILANTFANSSIEFTGWNTQADGQGTSYAQGATFAMPAENVVLYAQWKSNGGGGTDPTPDPTYTVSYDANGGSGTAPASPTEYKENATVTVLANTFTNGSKEFTGWNTQSDGKGTSYAEGATFAMPAANVVLYAQWKSNGGGETDPTPDPTYTVSYDANGGSGTAPAAPTGYKENATVTVLGNTFTNAGKEFIGWNTQADGHGTSYTVADTFAMPIANIVLYAQWKSNGGGGTPDTDPTYTVTYNANGGSGTAPAEPTQYKENATVTVLGNTFTNGSKSFIGWKDGDGNSYQANNTFSMPAKNVVLYAQWKSNSGGGGSGGDTTDYTSLTVNKVWENDKAENRPTSIAAQLYRNGTAYGNSVELNEQNGWTYTWRSLDDSYTWTVDEVAVPEGYEKTVTGGGTKYTITNKWRTNNPSEPENPVEPEIPTAPTPPTEPSNPNQPTKPDKLPQTNDTSAMSLWLIMSILSGLGLILLNAKKQRKTDTE